METWPKDRTNLYGAFAYSAVVLSCFGGFLLPQRTYYSSEAMVPVTFGLGAAYIALAILGEYVIPARHRWPVYFLIQCAILTAMVWLSPIRGFFGIMVLPVASHSIFDLGRRGAFLVIAYLYSLCIAVWGFPFGWNAALQAILSYSSAFAFTVVFTIMTKHALIAREREETLRRKLEAANEQLREHAAQAEDLATTRERNRLAREIHDGVGHYLTVVKTQLDAAAALLPSDPARAKTSIEKAARLAGDALDDVRRSVGTLRTDASRRPLADAVRQIAESAEPRAAVRVEGAPRAISASADHALFRAAQEALTNICKHSAATESILTLDFTDSKRVRLTVADNGRGANGTTDTGGFGLRGLRERIEILGGKVLAANRSGGGFELTVEVPS